MTGRNSPFDLDRSDVESLLEGQPAFRTRQVWDGLHRGLAAGEMTDLPQSLRSMLADALPPGLALERASVGDGGRTVKWLWSLVDGARIETVLMKYPRLGTRPPRGGVPDARPEQRASEPRPGRATVCISSQAGCAMACSFCATGQAGFTRHLSAGEMVEQVVRARAAAAPDRVGNVVFMGMGEPMANYDAMWAAVERLHGDLGISARHLTVSTVGVVPGIHRLAGERLPVNLAVSLHAANDTLRQTLVPLNRRYPLATLMDACRAYIDAKARRLSFEWALIDGVNDRAVDAVELAGLARPLAAHVNLIPLNRTPGYATRGTPPAGVRAFRDWLRDAGVNATVRHNRGTDIDAACGQLAAMVPPASSA